MPNNARFLLKPLWTKVLFLMVATYFIGTNGYVWFKHNGIVSPEGYGTLGRDFINYYTGAKIAVFGDPLIIFDKNLYWETLRQFYGEKIVFHNWSYPPHTLLLIWPLAFFPYLIAFAIWSCSGLAGFYYAMCKLTINKVDAAVMVFSPAVFLCLYTGQNGLFTATLILASFALLKKRPILAGILLGCLTFKPQLGILFPIALIMMREWKTILAASITTLVLVLISALVFGVETWQAFIFTTLPLQEEIIAGAQAPFKYMVPSLFMAFRNLGFSQDAALVAQMFTTLPALIAVIWGFSKQRPYELQIALFIVCTVMFSPYVVNYDMVMLVPAAYLYYTYVRKTNAPYLVLHLGLALLIALLPNLGQAFAARGFPLFPVAIFLFFIAVTLQLRKAEAQSYPKMCWPFTRRAQVLTAE